MVSRISMERFPVSKYCNCLTFVEEFGMMEKWFTASVALESNSPDQERSWFAHFLLSNFGARRREERTGRRELVNGDLETIHFFLQR